MKAIKRHIISPELKNKIKAYLGLTKEKYYPGDPEFGCRLALTQAVEASLSGNYGIGAALFIPKGQKIDIYFGQNKIISGLPTERFNTHAETDAIKSWMQNLEGIRNPDLQLHRISQKSSSIVLYSTVEPCPKCEIEITLLIPIVKTYLPTATRIQSISACLDGELLRKNGFTYSTGGAHAVGEKHKTSPLIWQQIQRGINDHQVVKFYNLVHEENRKPHSDANQLVTKDHELLKLSKEVWSATRVSIDQALNGIN